MQTINDPCLMHPEEENHERMGGEPCCCYCGVHLEDPPERITVASLHWEFDDGGRKAAGFKGNAGDCACRSIAIATGLPYMQVYADLNEAAMRERPGSKRRKGKRSNARSGVWRPTIHHYLAGLGWKWYPTMKIGTGCRVHLLTEELPMGRLIISCSKHITSMIDGVIHDTYDPSRGGTRCVYGYWSKPLDKDLVNK